MHARCAGYLVIEGFATPGDVRELRQRAEELVDSFNLDQITIFSTKSQVRDDCSSAIIAGFSVEEEHGGTYASCRCLGRTRTSWTAPAT